MDLHLHDACIEWYMLYLETNKIEPEVEILDQKNQIKIMLNNNYDLLQSTMLGCSIYRDQI